MAITASSGNISARVEARRPSWADMERYYPASEIRSPVLYDEMIGGRFRGLHLDPAYRNTCAVRMSYALNRSGLKLGVPPGAGGSIVGGDGYRYWIRVADLKRYLSKRFKGADEQLLLPAIAITLISDPEAMSVQLAERVSMARSWLDTKLVGRKGIVAFDVSGWESASGHFTLWNGSTGTLAYAAGHDNPDNNAYYFWLTSQREKADGKKGLVQVVSVKFWELI